VASINYGNGVCESFHITSEHNDNIQAEDYYDAELKDNGITLSYAGGNTICQADPTLSYTLNVNLICSEEDSSLKHQSSNIDGCNINLNYKHSKGCAVFSIGKFFAFVTTYWIPFAAALILLGVFLAFFGNKFVSGVIFIVTTLAFFILVGNLFFNLFMKNSRTAWVQWVVIVLIAIVGAIVGGLLVKYRKLGISILAGWGGAMLGVLLTSIFFAGSTAVYWIIIIGCAIVFAVAAYFLEKVMIQLITSFIGSYFLIRGISLFAGGFPNEIELHEQIASHAVDWSTMDKAIYGYMTGIVLLTGLSFYFQRKHDVTKDKYGL
jgi:hypothetical protein